MSDEKPFSFVGVLHTNPEVSVELGALLGEFAVMEFLLIKILALILNEESDMSFSHQILGNVMSISTRHEIVLGCAEKSRLNEEEKEKIRKALADLKSINSLRNEYVHALYETNTKTKEVARITWAASIGRKSKTEMITAESVKADRMRVMKRHGDIVRNLFGGEIQAL